MTMLLINGSFQITGTQPDGDTIHFTSNDPTEWALVGSGGRAVKHDVLGRAMLRLAPSGAVPPRAPAVPTFDVDADLLRTTANDRHRVPKPVPQPARRVDRRRATGTDGAGARSVAERRRDRRDATS